MLAGLIWPNYSEKAARHNLRQALFNLRKAIADYSAHPPYLLITRDENQFDTASDYALDVAQFDAHLAACESHTHSRLDACAVCASHLQQANDLYRGKFLQEFFLEHSAEFEEWALARREALHQRALDAVTNLAVYYEQHGDLGAARRCVLRQFDEDYNFIYTASPYGAPLLGFTSLLRARERIGPAPFQQMNRHKGKGTSFPFRLE